MRVILTGAGGQLGRELVSALPPSIDLVAFDRAALDITESDRVAAVVEEVGPAMILNAAAFTAVDRAEKETYTARAVNRDGVEYLATAAREVGARMIQVSTDFVFGGFSPGAYSPDDPADPLSTYGRTKHEGDCRVQEILGARALVVRTSRVYSRHGDNFVTKMLTLMGEREVVRVVDDQVGSPTWAALLARVLWKATRSDLSGIRHWCDGGSCTWFEFATAIQEEALARRILERRADLEPVSSDEFPTAARRPANSVLDSSTLCRELALEATPWRIALGRMLDEVAGIETLHE